MSANDQPWGGRFRSPLDTVALRYSRSFEIDRRLFREDISGSIAHAEMLGAQGIIARGEVRSIVRGLKKVLEEFEAGTFVAADDVEDIHMAVEQRLTELIGPAGGRLHTARSRNDQVATDTRLFMRGAIDTAVNRIRAVQRVVLELAEVETETVMPGYTHTQRAQPVLLAHHLLAWCAMLDRDRERLLDCRKRVNRSPLGAAALAGTSFSIDRKATANALGFDELEENSIDAVAARDVHIEFTAAFAILMATLSRIAEELVLWSTEEFGFITIGDAWTTGSSIMPQKKNPDMAELVRGRAGAAVGALASMLTMTKGLPLAYNRDMQEDKRPLFDAFDTGCEALEVMAGMISSITVQRDRMAATADQGYSTATELADYLTARGVPFREAHGVVGRIVGYCAERALQLRDLDLQMLQGFCPRFGGDALALLDPLTSIRHKRSSGSTAPREVARSLRRWRRRLAQ